MGYYITLTECNWIIPTENLDAAYEAMCALNERDDLKTGGSWEGGKMVEKWFSWMDTNYPETCPDAAAILQQLGFDVEMDDNLGLYIEYYDSKHGAQDHFLAAIAPFSREGSYINWRGEDGALWRDEVVGGKMVTYEGTVTYH